MSDHPDIRLVAASAGTGKTWRLCDELRQAIVAKVPPRQILATTFTNRAAAESLARARQALLSNGLTQEALELMLARIGTVNGVFGQIVGEFALPQGRSPVAAVIPEAAQRRIFTIAADPVISRHARVLTPLAGRFGFNEGRGTTDWRAMLADLVDRARSNGLDAAALDASARRSWAGLRAALPNPAKDGDDLNKSLLSAVDTALAGIGAGDAVGATESAIALMQNRRRDIAAGTLAWSIWARLGKQAASKAMDRWLVPVREAAAQHAAHPRLHADLETFIGTMFTAAAEAIAESQAYKRRRGLVDFVDQEAEALLLLRDPDAAAHIAGDIQLLLVDEFQDTSPIQLALFLRLARLVPRTMFVGDPKQAIFGFRGADPALVAAVSRRLAEQTGQLAETLAVNRRSRPALVEFPTLVLNEAFRVLGIDPGAVPVTPFREDAEGQSAPLALWRVPGRNAGLAQAALAARIARMVREGETMPVAARDEVWRTRPLRAGDIAVLVRKNDHARDLAAALAASGLKVALERDGLLDRAECVLALAGLRVLADSSDTLALAEIAHLREGDTARPVWLDTVLAHSAGARSLRELPFAQALAAARPDLGRLTPAEVLDLAIATLDLPALLPRWGDPAARHANLGALRALAAEYEADCRRERLPGSAAGLAAWFDTRDGLTQPASPDPDAVQVLTCHRAKGLEWPCVILADLDADDTPRLFNSPVAVAPPDGLDMDDPLRGRGVRLWPWPYGAQGTNVGLDTTALATAEGQEAAQSLKEENLRLLYVALTRARDYLVLAPRVSVTRAGARLAVDWLKMVPGAPLDLPATGDRVMIDGTPLPMIVEDLAAAATKASMLPDAWTAILPPGPPPDFAPRRLSPSAASGGDAPAYDVVILGDRLPLTGNADMRTLGEALHGFFAADRPGADRAWRLALAERLFRAWAVTEMAPEHALTAADRLWSYLDRTWPGAERHREWPVFARRDGQTLSGRADLVIAHGAGLAVFDHKSFPGPSRDWPALAAEYAPQLAAYASALEAATERKVDRRVVHLPVAGVLLVLR